MDVPRSPQDAPAPPRDEPLGTGDDANGSVSEWISDLKAGRQDAIQPLWDRYFKQLVERARDKLCALRSPMTVNDEEDVALSAFHALCEGVRAGRFPRCDDRDDLWRILVHLTACKAIDRHREDRRQKRGAGKVFREADLTAGHEKENRIQLDEIIGKEPSPEFAAIIAEEYRLRLEALGDPVLQQIAERKLACCTNGEIARELGVSLRNVTLKLELIRKRWKEQGEPS